MSSESLLGPKLTMRLQYHAVSLVGPVQEGISVYVGTILGSNSAVLADLGAIDHICASSDESQLGSFALVLHS